MWLCIYYLYIYIPLYARRYIYTWSASSRARRACFSMFQRERESSWEISDFHHFEARTCSEHACNKVHFAVESSDMSQNLDVHDVHQHALVSQSVSRMMYRYHVFLSTKVGAKYVSMRLHKLSAWKITQKYKTPGENCVKMVGWSIATSWPSTMGIFTFRHTNGCVMIRHVAASWLKFTPAFLVWLPGCSQLHRSHGATRGDGRWAQLT